MTSPNRSESPAPAVNGRPRPRPAAAARGRAAAEETPVSPLRTVHRLLRGRYWLAVPLAVLGLGAGAAVGWTLWKPQYESVAMVQVDPVIRGLAVDDERVMPAYDGFVGSQVELIRSERIAGMAMSSPTWRNVTAGGGDSDAATGAATDLDAFSAALSAERPRSSQLVRVSYVAPEPSTARAAVVAVTEAFMRVFAEQNVQSDGVRLQMLNNRRRTLSADLTETRERRREAAGELGEDGLQARYQLYLDELNRVEALVNETRLQLAAAGQDAAAPALAGTDGLEVLAGLDPRVRSLREDVRTLEKEVAVLRNQGYGDNHFQVARVRSRVRQAQADLDAAVTAAWDRGPEATAAVSGEPVAGGGGVADLRRVAAYAEERREEVQARVLEMAARTRDLQRLRESEATLKSDLDATVQNIEQFNVQASISGKLRLISEPTTPRTPVNASKKRQFVAAGAGLGASAGLGVMLLAGWLDRRVRYGDDIAQSLKGGPGPIRMLGTLPRLDDDGDEADRSEQMVWGVQHVRTLLQLEMENEPDGNLIAVTSAAPASGKTSLTLALGSSFASTRQKTLIIDFDLVGMGLTKRLDAVVQDQLGDLALSAGLLNRTEVDRAQDHARRSGQKLGAAMTELKLLERRQLDDLLNVQRTARRGLPEVLDGRPLDECVTPTGVPDLAVLPVGLKSDEQSGRVGTDTVRRIFAEARAAYDVVLVDTGPIPGTVETSVLASHADHVVVVVARGEPQSGYERAIGHLISIGANVAGVVFNRAEAGDLKTSRFSRSRQSDPLQVGSA